MNELIKDKLKLRRQLVNKKTREALEKEIAKEITKSSFKNDLEAYFLKSGNKKDNYTNELKRVLQYTRELAEAVIDCAIAQYLDDKKAFQYYKGVIMGECRIACSHGKDRPTGQSTAIGISLSMVLFKQVRKLVAQITRQQNKGTVWNPTKEEKYKS